MHVFPKTGTHTHTHKSTDNPNSMISFKFYVKTPIFITFTTISRPTTGILGQALSAMVSLFSVVVSERCHIVNTLQML